MDIVIVEAVTCLTFIAILMYWYKSHCVAKPNNDSQTLTISNHQKGVPAPPIKDPNTGNLKELGESGSLHQYLTHLHKQYGPIVQFQMGAEPMVSVADPVFFQHVAKLFDRPASLYSLFEPLLTTHAIGLTNGQEGKFRHAAYTRCFGLPAMQKNIAKIQQIISETMEKFYNCTEDEHIPLTERLMDQSVKTLLLVAFGKKLEEDKEVTKLWESFDFVWTTLEDQLLGITLTDECDEKKKMNEEIGKIHAIINSFLHYAEDKLESNDPDETMVADVMTTMNLQHEEKIADFSNLLVGGIHTVAYLSTWCLYYLATRPELQVQIVQEIRKEIPEYFLKSANAPQVDVRDIQKLVFLSQVIDETLRCSALGPYTARVSYDNDIKLGEYKIAKGMTVIQAVGVSFQDQKYWPNPEEFDPDRFSSEKRKQIPKFGFEPFGFAGKRICPGFPLGIVQTKIFLIELLSKFEISLVPGQEEVKKVYGLVTKPNVEIWVNVKRRM